VNFHGASLITFNFGAMPKVLRIINRFNLGGPTYNVAYLTKHLSNGFETKLIGGMKDEQEESSEFIVTNLGLSCEVIPEMKRSINPIQDYAAYLKIKKIIREYKPDIVHTHAAKAGALGRRAAIACNVPVILHTFHGHVFHSYFNQLQTTYIKYIERSLAKKTTAIVAISDKQKEELTNEYKIVSEDKVQVIPLGFDLDRFAVNKEINRTSFREKHGLQADVVAIGIVGRLAPIKNHDLFVEAIDYVKSNTDKPIKAFVIGDGETREALEKKVNHLNLKNDFIFTSWEKKIETAYPGLDIVCLTSLNEGTPVSLIEAQAAGKPIVSTNVGGISNAVIPNQTAFISDVNNKELFKQNLLELVNNADRRKEMSLLGYEFVTAKYSYHRLVADTECLYRKLLANCE
jgi:glycosyltransferase involved in cell wall biosynthesis